MLLTRGDYYLHLLTSLLIPRRKPGSQQCIERAMTGCKAIMNVAHCGKFSSDRTIAEYAPDIRKVKAVPVIAETETK